MPNSAIGVDNHELSMREGGHSAGPRDPRRAHAGLPQGLEPGIAPPDVLQPLAGNAGILPRARPQATPP